MIMMMMGMMMMGMMMMGMMMMDGMMSRLLPFCHVLRCDPLHAGRCIVTLILQQ
jgi:type IV secretory pathway TrbF-like protein